LGFSILSEYSLWFIPLCLLTAFGYTLILYYKNKKHAELSRIQRWTLRVLRFAAVFLISFLLLSPFVDVKHKEIQKPVIVLAQDNSASITLNKDSVYYKNEYPSAVKNLISQLADEYDTACFSFGNKTEQLQKVSFNQQGTDFSQLFSELKKQYYNRNLGAVIIASDGIFNQGSGPVYAAEQLTMNIPVYSLALGDTLPASDVLISDVQYNEIAFEGIKSPLKIDVSANQMQGKLIKLSIKKQNRTLYTTSFTADSENFSKTIETQITPDKTGLQVYDIIVNEFDGELSHQNNSKRIAIEVLKSKKKILLISAFPHPDVAAVKRAVSKNLLYELETAELNNLPENTNEYSLALCFYLSSEGKKAVDFYNKARKEGLPVLNFISAKASLLTFNAIQSGCVIEAASENSDFVTAVHNENFSVFNSDKDIAKLSETKIPLFAPYGDYSIDADCKVLFYQKIGTIETQRPLIWMQSRSSYKSATICGEGLWRWRIEQMVKNGSFENFDQMVNKLINYLSVSERKERFIVKSENIWNEGQNIEFAAELYNENYEPVNEPDISLEIKNEEGNTFKYQFTKKGNQYSLNAGNFVQGTYNWTAVTTLGDKTMKKTGAFTVIPVNIEALNTLADHSSLQLMSANHSAQLFYPQQMDDLVKAIRENTDITALSYSRSSLRELISFWWYFSLIAVLLAAEWLLRKYWGLY